MPTPLAKPWPSGPVVTSTPGRDDVAVALGVARRDRAPLAELLDLVHREVVAREVQDAVEQHRPVAGAEDEAVAVGPRRIRRVVAHDAAEEDVGRGRHGHRQAGMPGVGLLDRVHGQRANRVDAELVCLGGHGRVVSRRGSRARSAFSALSRAAAFDLAPRLCHVSLGGRGGRPIRTRHGEPRARRGRQSKEPHHAAQDARRRSPGVARRRGTGRRRAGRDLEAQGHAGRGVRRRRPSHRSYPGRHRAQRKAGTKVVRATIGLDAQVPGAAGHHDPRRRRKNLPISSGRQVLRRAAGPADPRRPRRRASPPTTCRRTVTGRLNKARTRIKGTWRRKVVIYSPADPTGATVLDTLRHAAR